MYQYSKIQLNLIKFIKILNVYSIYMKKMMKLNLIKKNIAAMYKAFKVNVV
jgi:hypothetical protein